MQEYYVDRAAERAVIASLLKYGKEAYADVSDLVKESSFTLDTYAAIYTCASKLLDSANNVQIDVPLLYSTAKEVGCFDILNRKEDATCVRSCFNLDVNLSNVRKLAAKLKKLEIARTLDRELNVCIKDLRKITGEETITQILAIAENAVLDFSSRIDSGDNGPELVGFGLREYVEYLRNNPVQTVGISTGYPRYDAAIGGGLRRKSVSLIGARPKIGKSSLAANIGINISKQNIKVLYLDTEMDKKDQWHRLLAMLSGVPIKKIETGQFGSDEDADRCVNEAVGMLEKSGFSYINISGKSFEEVNAIMRRWVSKEVGKNKDGVTNDCVIIYDYLKLVDQDGLQNLQEFQLLGFQMMCIHNFAVKYDVPVLAFIQLNRDGITKESTDVASGSDRLIWFCSNFSIFKVKEDEEAAEEATFGGNRKMVVLVCRHGPGLSPGDYISMNMKGECCYVEELLTRNEAANNAKLKETGFEIVDGEPNEYTVATKEDAVF